MIVGVGTDLIEIARVKLALRRRPSLEKRLFLPAEIAYCRHKADPYPSFAARFAAKEAVLKAMGMGIGACSWQDISIEVNARGAPEITMHGQGVELARSLGIKEFKVSVSHTKFYALAHVIALQEGE